jgi:hypothetical protein
MIPLQQLPSLLLTPCATPIGQRVSNILRDYRAQHPKRTLMSNQVGKEKSGTMSVLWRNGVLQIGIDFSFFSFNYSGQCCVDSAGHELVPAASLCATSPCSEWASDRRKTSCRPKSKAVVCREVNFLWPTCLHLVTPQRMYPILVFHYFLDLMNTLSLLNGKTAFFLHLTHH